MTVLVLSARSERFPSQSPRPSGVVHSVYQHPIHTYQDFAQRKQSQKRKETKRNEGRVHKKRCADDVEKVEDVEKVADGF